MRDGDGLQHCDELHCGVVPMIRRFFSAAGMRIALAVFAALLVTWPSAGRDRPRINTFNRLAARPSGHSFIGNQIAGSSSYFEKSIVWPAGALNARLEFDYLVDSEPTYDWLKVRVDGTQVWSVSGRNQVGHGTVPVTPGSHMIRFEYYKDPSVDAGRDTAAVDNVFAYASNVGRIYASDFNERVLDAPDGWVTGGHSGGWSIARHPDDMALTRPGSHSFLGYQAASTTSYTQRSITLAAAGSVKFGYLVDSELGYDFLRVLVDGAVLFQESGSKRGIGSVNVPAGTHTLRIEYLKDTSVDAGRDLARVYDLTVRKGTEVVETISLDGEAVGAVPSLWQSGGTGAGWILARPMPPRIYVDPVAPAYLPINDGAISPESGKEYVGGAKLTIPDNGVGYRSPGMAIIQVNPALQRMYFAFQMPAVTPGNGDERGQMELLFDANHLDTLSSRGCASHWQPRAEDRKLQVNYLLPVGQTSVTATVNQSVGNCSGWVTATAQQSWTVVAKVSETSEDNPTHNVDVEVFVDLRSADGVITDAFSSHYLGFGLIASATNAANSAAFSTWRLPYVDRLSVTRSDITSWETLAILDRRVTPDIVSDNFGDAAFTVP